MTNIALIVKFLYNNNKKHRLFCVAVHEVIHKSQPWEKIRKGLNIIIYIYKITL